MKGINLKKIIYKTEPALLVITSYAINYGFCYFPTVSRSLGNLVSELYANAL